MPRAAQGEKKRGGSICGALRHPLRVRILEVLNEGPKSPSQFVEEGLVPKEMYESYPQALSLASYHFRELHKDGCVKIIETIQRRGAVEHIYEGTARVYFTDEEWAELPERDRRELSRISMQGLVARTENAQSTGTFDGRLDRHLTWMPMGLDERGWEEMTARLAACFGDMEQIKHDAADRLAGSGDRVVWATFGMLGFESPPPADLAAPADDGGHP